MKGRTQGANALRVLPSGGVLPRYLSFFLEVWPSRHTLLGSNLFDLALAQPNRGREELAFTPQFLAAQALRCQHLAAKARRQAIAVSANPVALRSIKLAERLEGDDARDEEEARILLAEQREATPLRQHDRDSGASGRSCERPRPFAEGQQQ